MPGALAGCGADGTGITVSAAISKLGVVTAKGPVWIAFACTGLTASAEVAPGVCAGVARTAVSVLCDSCCCADRLAGFKTGSRARRLLCMDVRIATGFIEVAACVVMDGPASILNTLTATLSAADMVRLLLRFLYVYCFGILILEIFGKAENVAIVS